MLTKPTGILNKAQLPIVLVACKCDQHPAHRHVDTAVIEQRAKTFIDGLCAFQTSESAPETHRACLSVIARAAIAAKRRKSLISFWNNLTLRTRNIHTCAPSMHFIDPLQPVPKPRPWHDGVPILLQSNQSPKRTFGLANTSVLAQKSP